MAGRAGRAVTPCPVLILMAGGVMDWLIAAGLGLALWWLFDIRRLLGLKVLPPALPQRGGRLDDVDRYTVVRWPQGTLHYNGAKGVEARKVYESQHPAPGEAIEFYDEYTRRGRKEG